MKKIIFLFLLISLYSVSVHSINPSYETKFYKIDINDKIIADGKKREIKKIKILTIYDILNKLLVEEDFNNIQKLINFDDEVDFLIKNIIIENEFIKSNKYSSDVKINFDNKEIINILRNNKFDYIDYISSDHLIIVAEKNQLFNEGLSVNNSFYNKKMIQSGLLKLIVPDLSANDRFLLSYKNIINKDIDSINKLSKKYKTEYVFIVLVNELNNNFLLDISLFTAPNLIFKIDDITINKDSDISKNLYSYLNNWWKKNNLIDNSISKIKTCHIKNSNLYEVNFINSKINLLSQIKSNSLKQISLGYNTNKIVFYGKISNLTLKLKKFNIFLKVNDQGRCLISTFK